MTQQVINIGSAPDDGTGDPTRTAFNKTNQNFTELYARPGGAPVGAEYITSTADATLTSERVLTDTATVTWDRTTAGQIKANAAGGAPLASPAFTGNPTAPTPTPNDNDTSIATTAFVTAAVAVVVNLAPPQGRLTLQTLTPVMTTTQASKAAIFYTPSVCGNLVPLYNGTNFFMSPFSELTSFTTDATKAPAAIGANKVNDWFVWNDAGQLQLGHGPDWTSDTTRSAGTALVMVNGILLNAVAITNGPAAQRGTYVGSTRSNASSQLDWLLGGSAIGGVAAFLGVWNCYNRVNVSALVRETTSSWSSVNGVGPLNGSTNNRVTAVFGLAEDSVTARATAVGWPSVGTYVAIGIGLNSTTVISGIVSGVSLSSTDTGYHPIQGELTSVAPLGANFWQSMETSNGAGGGFANGAFSNVALTFTARM